MGLRGVLNVFGVIALGGMVAGCFGFTAQPMSGEAPLLVQFRDTSNVVGPPSRVWHFGDYHVSDEENTSREETPLYLYKHPGTYTVTLRVQSFYGTFEGTLRKQIEVTPGSSNGGNGGGNGGGEGEGEEPE